MKKDAIVAANLLVGILMNFNLYGQIKVTANPNPTPPHASSILELESNLKGFLPPRMSTTERLAISQPADGLLIYDSTDSHFHYYAGGRWNRIENNFGGRNTLNQAYNQGGAGAGRSINTISGPVEMNASGQNTNLLIRNSFQKGIDVLTNNGIGFYGIDTGTGTAIDITSAKGPALLINKTDTGYGLRAITGINLGRDVVSATFAANTNSNYLKPNGRAGYFSIEAPFNNQAALQGNTLGRGYGLAGITGEWPSVTNLVAPPSGVLGLSFLTHDRRNGVTGYSAYARGVQGITGYNTGWALPAVDSMQAGVFGRGAFSPDGNPSAENAIFAGVIGHVTSGFGVLGANDGYGHGVIGVTYSDQSNKTQAGVWGLAREATTWPLHTVSYPFTDGSNNKGRLGVLGQSKSEVAIWAESETGLGLVGTIGRRLGKDMLGGLKCALMGVSTLATGLAGAFFADTTSMPAVLVNSRSAMVGMHLIQLHTGKGAFIEKSAAGIGLHIETKEATNGSPGLLSEHFGLGPAGEFKIARVTSPTEVLRLAHAGLGQVIKASITHEANSAPAITTITNGLGMAADFSISRPPAALPKNSSPALRAVTNGIGSAAYFGVASGGATEPAVEINSLSRRGLYIHINNDTTTTDHNFFYGNGRGHMLKLEGGTAVATSKPVLKVEGFNGYVAHFDQKAAGVVRADPAMLISTASTRPNHAALRITTAAGCGTCYAAFMEGRLEVSKDTKIGGKLDVDGATTIENSFRVNGATTLDGGVFATSGMSVTGSVSISGLCSAGSFTANSKLFSIPHPLDEKNKILRHACTESNEHLVQYSGNITTNALGFAAVTMPDYVGALATDFRYQLTVVGKQFAQAIVFQTLGEVAENANQFLIRTDKPGIEISWLVTGKRQDKHVLENPLIVESDK